MKLKRLILISAILTTIVYLLFYFFQGEVIVKITPYFPVKDDKTVGYFIDLVHLVASELLWVSIFLIMWWYLLGANPTKLISNAEDILMQRPTVTVASILIIYVAITYVVATRSLEQFPNSADEYAYIFQAEMFSKGKLWYKAHDLADFFQFNHIAQKDGIWISRFPPGWPILLSLGYLLNVPLFAVNLVLGGVVLLVFYNFVKFIYNQRIAVWSLLTLTFTSFFIFNSASYFSHVSSLLEGLLFVYFFYLYLRKDNKIAYALLAGLFLGLMVINRYFTAALLCLPFVIYGIIEYKWQILRLLFWIGIGCLPSLAFLLWYNYVITGNPLLPVTMWAYHNEALGFINGHTPLRSVDYFFRRALMFIYWCSPALLILYVVFAIRKITDKVERYKHPEDYVIVFLAAGYCFYYQLGGNQYGPRFYFEAFPFIALFVVIRVLQSNLRWATALLITGLIFSLLKMPFIANREHQVILERKDLYAQVQRMKIHNAVVFISSNTSIVRPMSIADLTRNDEQYKNDVLYAIDLQYKNKYLVDRYKNRNFYLYSRSENSCEGKLVPLREALVTDSPLHFSKD